MIDGLRAEFPGATGWIMRLRQPIVARESLWWAFLSAAGAGFIMGGIVGLMLLTAVPVIFPATEPRPSWLTYPVLTQTAAAIAIGAVALRSGGRAALALYVLYQLALIVATFPGRQRLCLFGNPTFPLTCDIPGLIVDRWPIWLALAIGAAVSRWLLRAGDAGANPLLRGAGVFAVALTAATTTYGLLTITTLSFRQSSFDFIFTGVYVLGQIVGALLAGLVLRRAPMAATVLLAALILSAVAATLPNVLANRIPNMPLELLFLQWAVVVAPVLGAATLVAVHLIWRRDRRRPGTIS